MPWILEVLEGLNVPAISKVGYEADDVIGFLAKKAAAEGFDVYMMTPDKDFGQLVTDKIRMFRPGRGGNPAEVWGPDEIREKFDVTNRSGHRLARHDGRQCRQHTRHSRRRCKTASAP